MAPSTSTLASAAIPEKPHFQVLLEDIFELWVTYRHHDLWNAPEAVHRLELVAGMIGVDHRAPEFCLERIRAKPFDTNLESALAGQFRFVPFFFALARTIRERSTGGTLKPFEALESIYDLITGREGLLEAALFLDQTRGAKIAEQFEQAFPFDWAFSRELDCVLKSRRLRCVAPTSVGGSVLEDRSKDAQLFGLALSGGGIRSATLNLGLLQALGELDLLRYIDYLSTVSGGGYIGSWLHGWIRKEESLDKVRKYLSPKDSPDPESNATHPIKWLRQYSNYLSPRLGLFSVDAWTIVSVWLRNTLLNLLVLIPFVCGLLLIPRFFTGLADFPNLGGVAALSGLIVAWYLIQCNIEPAAQDEPDADLPGKSRLTSFIRSQRGIRTGMCCALFVSAVGMAAALGRSSAISGVELPGLTSWLEQHQLAIGVRWGDLVVGPVIFVVFAVLLFVLSRKYYFPIRGYRTKLRIKEKLLGSLLPALVGAVLMVASARVLVPGAYDPGWRWHLAALGAPAIILIYFLVIVLHLGLLGRTLPDWPREWWSRLSALLTIGMFGWCGLFGAAIYGPLFLAWLMSWAYGWYAASGLGAGWVITTIAGILTARSSSTTGKERGSLTDMLAKAAPAVFVAGLVLLLSSGIHLLSLQGSTVSKKVEQPARLGAEFQIPGEGGRRLHISYNSGPKPLETTVTLDLTKGRRLPTADQLRILYFDSFPTAALGSLLAALALGALALFVASRVDVNEFSMHHLYRNRLVRCYLGASRRKRRANFTGFDPEDDFPISSLDFDKTQYPGPYPIVNAALNLVKGDELAWQERKAESFVFTPLFSGFDAAHTEEVPAAQTNGRRSSLLEANGYRTTKSYASIPDGISMGTAVAISGAAVSPNMGYHTSAAVAFLLTVFNVRMGWWIGNPRRRDGWFRPGPKFGLFALLRELTASTDDKSRFLYLSDGGHFENLGIYELVRRRCQYIIASDGGCDPRFSFEDLGNAIRKCRTDFGAEIKIECGGIPPPSGAPYGRAHCAVGTIEYRDGLRGTLVYIKASLTGDEPTDVLEYAHEHGEFPHQPTGDQMFDEAQFESYRQLGYHTGMKVFGETLVRRKAALGSNELDANQTGPIGSDRDRFFSDLREYWYASSPKVSSSFTRHAEVLTKLMQQLRDDPNLAFMDEQISPEWHRFMQGRRPPLSSGLGLPATYQERRAGFHFCNSLMQLMEDVYLDLNLEDEADHPDNAGWINLFKHWSWSSMFRVNWAISAGCYGARFREFCLYRLGMGVDVLGEVTVDEVCGFRDQRLNYLERELLAARADPEPGITTTRRPMFLPGRDRVFVFQLTVNAPERTHAALIQLDFGIAVIDEHGALAYFRVQDHVRRMGLARRAMEKMVPKDGAAVFNKEIKWRTIPKDFPEPVEEENRRRVEIIWEAAWLSRLSRSLAAMHDRGKPDIVVRKEAVRHR